MDTLFQGMMMSTHGMKAQGSRMRVISENIANADTGPERPGEDPYTKKVITFKNELDRKQKIDLVQVDSIKEDTKRPFVDKYMPDHPSADANGYVKMPNINSLMETMNMRESMRSYEANLGMFEQSAGMYSRTVDVLRN